MAIGNSECLSLLISERRILHHTPSAQMRAFTGSGVARAVKVPYRRPVFSQHAFKDELGAETLPPMLRENCHVRPKICSSDRAFGIEENDAGVVVGKYVTRRRYGGRWRA